MPFCYSSGPFCTGEVYLQGLWSPRGYEQPLDGSPGTRGIGDLGAGEGVNLGIGFGSLLDRGAMGLVPNGGNHNLRFQLNVETQGNVYIGNVNYKMLLNRATWSVITPAP